MDIRAEPNRALAQEVLPAPLYQALAHIFQGEIEAMLVGGTALAGFYAGHRRSDDLDLFVPNRPSHRAVALRARRLSEVGAAVDVTVSTPEYFNATCELDGHAFTIDVVLDENLFRVGEWRSADDLRVASLETLLMTKAATLVSRCGEKDLYDLWWLLGHLNNLDLVTLLAYGSKIDAGVDAETVLMVVATTELRKAACGFATDQGKSPTEVYATVTALKAELQQVLLDHLRGLEVPPLGQLVRKVRGLR